MKIKIVNKSPFDNPSYKTPLSAGMDIRANVKCDLTLETGERTVIPTGLFLELPKGYEAQIRPRSGLALNNGVTVLNTPGTIDADYRGEIKVILINLGESPFTIKQGDRIAQMVIAKHERAELISVDELSETTRGEGGFGSTGTK